MLGTMMGILIPILGKAAPKPKAKPKPHAKKLQPEQEVNAGELGLIVAQRVPRMSW